MRKVNIKGYLNLQIDQVVQVTDEEYNKFIAPIEEDFLNLTFEAEDFLITRIDHEDIEDVFFEVTEVNNLE